MKYLPRALEQALAQVPMSQADLAKLSSVNQSTISRIVAAKTKADLATFDALLNAFEDLQIKADLIVAFIRDQISPEARKLVSINPSGAKHRRFQTEALSEEGKQALAYILELQHQGEAIEPVIIDFARAVGFNRSGKPT